MRQSEPQARTRGHLCETIRAQKKAPARRIGIGVQIGAVAALLLVIAGCERKPVPERPAPVIPQVKTSTPEEATTSLLLLLQAEMRAVGRKDQATADKCRELCSGVVATKALAKELKTYKPILGDNPLAGLINNWGATIAAYADSFDFEHLSVPEFTDADKAVGVYVPAIGRDGRADLRLECVRDDAEWRVASLTFESTKAIKIPVSAIGGARAPAPPPESAPAQP